MMAANDASQPIVRTTLLFISSSIFVFITSRTELLRHFQ